MHASFLRSGFMGPIGQKGMPGISGRPGVPGFRGEVGHVGHPGLQGMEGRCDSQGQFRIGLITVDHFLWMKKNLFVHYSLTIFLENSC